MQRCGDGTLVLFHDDFVVDPAGERHRIGELSLERFAQLADAWIGYDEALEILRGRAHAHIDLKFCSPKALHAWPESTHEVAAVRRAIEVLGDEAMIVTTLEDDSVRSIRAWSRTAHPDLLVGLSLGRALPGARLRERLAVRFGELFPRRRISGCDANLVVANKRLARLTLAQFAAMRRLPLLVWTVDDARELARWLGDPRVWLLTTNYPERAAMLRTHRRRVGR